jgi:hypothetical protein
VILRFPINFEPLRLTSNPYKDLPDRAFWRRAVSSAGPALDPVTTMRFGIAPADCVATAGSCFAQHIARELAARGSTFLVTEPGPYEQGFGVYPARFGNLYTPRQLLQLFRRAYALMEPAEEAWRRPDGRLVDPFRPQAVPEGFVDIKALRADRERHLAAVREMFENCDVLVFTLGLTEAWEARADGAVLPLAPGVVAEPTPDADHPGFAFRNFTVAEMTEDVARFTTALRRVNPGARLLLTVSPVPLIATYEPRHVLVSTAASKAALRVVVEEAMRADPGTDYFPSYEIITGPQSSGRFFAEDLRSVTAEGVATVMDIFARHYLGVTDTPRPLIASAPSKRRNVAEELDELAAVNCDEEAIDQPAAHG